MTPSEMMTLYGPILICWFLVWLTNVSEYVSPAPQTGRDNRKQYSLNLHTEKNESYFEKGNAPPSDIPSLPWNVSNFFSS